MRIGSLCSGYGGLDLAVEQFYEATTAWHCEYEAAPSKILAHHWDVPNHHDLTTTDWDTVEPVDIVTAGWPCQPWSVAGAQRGIEDERAIWPGVADAIRLLRPRYVVLENVSAIVVLGELARAVGNLASLGYDAQWQCVRASDIGAPHRRERCFIVAQDTDSAARDQWGQSAPRKAEGGRSWTDAGRRGGAPTAQPIEPGLKASRGHDTDGRGDVATNTTSIGRNQRRSKPAGLVGRPDVAERSRASVAHPNRGERDGREQDQERIRVERTAAAGAGGIDWGNYEPAIRRWEAALGRPAPVPTEPGRNGQRLSPLLVEWMMGLPAGWVTDPAIGLTRNQQLMALGNGVVPQQAFEALCRLWP